MKNRYQFQESVETITPALIYYQDIIEENIKKTIAIAGSAERLWPHVKTHKMAEMIHLQMEMGITRFKCATIAEAEMAAACGAGDVMIAYPLVGPNISRFLWLQKAFPSIRFYAMGDDQKQLALLSEASLSFGVTTRTFLDVNMGMDRTGVPLNLLEEFYLDCLQLNGLHLEGLHCYDGHRTEADFQERKQASMAAAEQIRMIRASLSQQGVPCDTLIMGGTSSFSCYLELEGAYFSPGTLFVNDYGYTKKFPDMVFTPGAAVLTRVISCPLKGHFTLDLGYKGIASDPEGSRGVIAGMEHVQELFQSEEHWAFCMESGYEDQCPQVGDEFYVVPTHICPTSALYPSVIVVKDGKAEATWQVTARNRKITY